MNDANYGAFSDWRMPTIKELAYIVNYSIPYPGTTIDTGYFPNTQPSWYWSSTAIDYSASYTCAMNFDYGNDSDYYKYSEDHARVVRNAQPTHTLTACTAALDENLSLHIPVLSYLIPYWRAPSYCADLLYEYNPSYPTIIPFKLTNAGVIL